MNKTLFENNTLISQIEIQNKTTCSECGTEVSSRTYPIYPCFCERCKPIKNIKENWKPLGSGKVSKIFVIT